MSICPSSPLTIFSISSSSSLSCFTYPDISFIPFSNVLLAVLNTSEQISPTVPGISPEKLEATLKTFTIEFASIVALSLGSSVLLYLLIVL